MPATSSSLINAALGHLVDLPDADRAALTDGLPSLLDYLAWVPDPRDPRGVRHTLVSLLGLAAAAVLAGSRGFTATREWIWDASPQVLAAFGVRRDPLTRRYEPPDETTIRRLVQDLDADALDLAIGSWLARTFHAQDTARRYGDNSRPARRAVAVDGKALRGTRHHTIDGQALHLLSVLDQAAGIVLNQTDVDGKKHEITRFEPLLEPLDMVGAVVTADALHTQRDHAEFLVTRKRAHYILVVKKNQPSLYAQVKGLPWRNIPIMHAEDDHGRGRDERRTLKVVSLAEGLLFPHAAQAIRVTRRTRKAGSRKWKTITIYAVTSLAVHHARPAELAAWIRGHWSIEALHHVRDVSFGEDASQVRTRKGPRVMASLRNLTTGIFKLTGHENIAAALPEHSRDATRTLTTLAITPA
ncbi:MAG: transposase, family [Gemmatimonadales bacterium]|nr:transposase, family [Gemmatimonadales bacterium]